MKNKGWKTIVLPGVLCAACMAASTWYAIRWNEGRLVKPMDFSSYVFRLQDLPMMGSVILVTLYVFYLVALGIRFTLTQRRNQANSRYTRSVSPKLGFLGLLGFLGFAGFWTCQSHGKVFPFVFFIFFGFFGFFYEGKMSHTLMDERYKENQMRAQLVASRTALGLILMATVIFGQGFLGGTLTFTFSAYVIIVSLTLALHLFLGEYLLYHYDHDAQSDESED